MDWYLPWVIGFVMGNLCCYFSLARPVIRKWTEAVMAKHNKGKP